MIACLIAAALGTAAPGIVFFEGPPGGVGDVRVLDPLGVELPLSPPALQGVELLPIDFVGRTEVDLLAPDRPRLRDDVPGASRLELQGGRGSLYRFRRADAAGTAFGLFLVDTGGAPRVLFELAGAGPAGDAEPFGARIAVSPAADALLLATSLDAGGDLVEVDVATGAATLRTASLPPRAFSPAGLLLAETWGIGAHPSGVVRFPRGPLAQARDVGFPGAPPFFGGEVVLSGDGLVAATTAGADADNELVYTFTTSGDARQVSANPAPLAGAGYLPEHAFGPYLALNADGSACAWIVDWPDSREAFFSNDAAPTPTSSFQLTSDGLYLDTLDEIGVLFFSRLTDALVLAVGEIDTDPGGTIENIDLYRVDTAQLPATGIQNLSQSSGTATPPFFTKSAIDPSLIVRVPETDDLLVLDLKTEELRLVTTDAVAPELLFANVQALELIESTPDDLLLSLRLTDLGGTRRVVHLAKAQPASPSVLADLDGGAVLASGAARPDGWASFVISTGPMEWIARVHLPTETGQLLFVMPFLFGSTISLGSGGTTTVSLAVPGFPAYLLAWTPTGPVLLADEPSQGFVLPGS